MPATFPTAYTAALAARQVQLTITFEIEGWPTACANRPLPGAWFSGRSAWLQPGAVKQLFKLGADGQPDELALSAVALDLLKSRSNMGTLRVPLVDLDGSLALLTGLRRAAPATLQNSLNRTYPGAPDISTTTFTMYLDGDTSAIAANYPPPAGMKSYLYVGRECFQQRSGVSAGAVTVTRAQLGTIPQAHTGSVESDSSNNPLASEPTGSSGDVVSTFPRHLVDRKVWLRVGYNAQSDADTVLAFVGCIRDYGWQDGGRTLLLNCEDAQAKMKRPVFTDLSTRWYPAGNAQAIKASVNRTTSDGHPTIDLTGMPPDFSFVGTAEPFFGIINDVPYALAYNSQTGPTSFNCNLAQPRNWFRAAPYPDPVDQAPMGAVTPLGEFRPMAFIAIGTSHASLAQYCVWPNMPGGVPAHHVLAILLLVLCSTGTGSGQADNFATAGYNGPFDLLKAEWGLGIPQAEIDIAGITALATMHPERTVRVPILDVVPDAREWLINLLRPWGYALAVNAAGQISVVSMDPLSADEKIGLPTLSMSDVALDPGGQPRKLLGPVSAGEQRVVAIRWSDSPFIRDGKLELRQPVTLQLAEDADAVALNGAIEPLVVEAPSIESYVPGTDYSADGTISFTGRPIFVSQNGGCLPGPAVVGALLTNLAVRFGGSPFVFTMEVWLAKSELSTGDFVSLTLPWAPNPFTGQRGLTNVTAQVTSRRPNLLAGTIELELTVSGAGNENVRYLAPSFVLSGWTAGTLTAGIADTFNNGSFHDTDALGPANTLLPGIAVRVYPPDHSGRSQAVTIAAKSGTNALVLSAAPVLQLLGGGTRAPQAGDVIELADYAEQGNAAVKARYAWLADPATELLGGVDAAVGWG